MSKAKKISTLSVLAIFIVTLSLLTLTSCTGSTEAGEAETFTVVRGDIEQTVTSTGYVDTVEKKNYSLQASGEVFQSLEDSAFFKKGDILIEIDNSRTKIQIEQAEKNLETAKSSLDLAKINYQQALDANHIAVQLGETNTDLAEQAAQNAFTALEDANGYLKEIKDYEFSTDPQIAQAKSQANASEGAYEQSAISQSSTYWQNLSSTQSAGTQIRITAENIEQVEIQVELSENNLELAKLDTDNNIVHAPFDGIVLSSTFSEGEYASPGITAISVISSDYIIKTQISETDISKLSPGDEVKITLDAYPEDTFAGSIEEISPLSQSISSIVSFEVTIKPEEDNSPNMLYGISANLTIITSKVESVIYIPIEYVYEEGGKEYVDIMGEDEMSRKREIVTGLYGNNHIEVISGLSEGDILVILQD